MLIGVIFFIMFICLVGNDFCLANKIGEYVNMIDFFFLCLSV